MVKIGFFSFAMVTIASVFLLSAPTYATKLAENNQDSLAQTETDSEFIGQIIDAVGPDRSPKEQKAIIRPTKINVVDVD